MPNIEYPIKTLLNEHEVARITGMSVGSVRRWRLLRSGPRFLKLFGAIKYKIEDLEAWIESRPSGGDQMPTNRVIRNPSVRATIGHEPE